MSMAGEWPTAWVMVRVDLMDKRTNASDVMVQLFPTQDAAIARFVEDECEQLLIPDPQVVTDEDGTYDENVDNHELLANLWSACTELREYGGTVYAGDWSISLQEMEISE